MKRLLCVVGFAAAVMITSSVEAGRNKEMVPYNRAETTNLVDKDVLKDFMDLKFGMFIHYNMATYTCEKWTKGYPDPSTFDPGVETIDTDAWADAAKSAGMKYAVLTVKHVGGFCLWDSKYTTYDVMHPDCPYKKDIVAQFVKSFTSRGLKVGFYYCWRHPGFDHKKYPEGIYKVLPPECDHATHSMEEQVKFQKAQIVELLTKYPEAFYIWNDGLDPAVTTADDLLDEIRKVNPKIIASSNWWSDKGQQYLDIAVTEKGHFPEDNKLPGETCWVLERGWWFFKPGARVQSADVIMQELKTANSRNANFLLNVGPDKQGNIKQESIKQLERIGKMLSD